MEPTAPFNIWPMQIDDFIKKNFIQEVTSQMIYEPSSTNFHPDGFFSEQIFGELGSPTRLNKLGYISLNTDILPPLIYKNTIDLKPIYDSIMQGKTYAIYNEDLHRFDICTKDTLNAETGYAFFIKHFNDIQFDQTASARRTNKIKAIEKAKEVNATIVNKMLIAPAGIRDIREDHGRIAIEEINKYYNSLLSISQEVKNSLINPILARFYDGIKYNIQLKVYEIYKYWENFLDGKTGFAQRRYARRGIAWGTRNVVTSAEMTGTDPSDPTYLKHQESIIPIFQAAKAFQPLVIFQLRSLFYNQIFTFGSTRVAAINPLTKKIEYIEVSDNEVTKALSNQMGEDIINMFQNTNIRLKPVTIKDKEDNKYWLFLIYDTGDEIYVLRNIDDFQAFMTKNRSTDGKPYPLDMNKLRPITYLEMMYFATYFATRDKYCTITRYPAIELGSIYPTKVKIGTTIPSREVYFTSQYEQDYDVILPHYPILGNAYLDSTIFHPSQAAGLGADYDGDTVSVNGLLSTDATEECEKYYNSPKSIVTLRGTFLKSGETNLTRLTIFNLTRLP